MKIEGSIYKKLAKIAIVGLLLMLLASLGSSSDPTLHKDWNKKAIVSGGARSSHLLDGTKIPLAISPRSIAGSKNPNFKWSAVADATQYTLKLRDPSGLITLRTLEADDVTVNSNCLWASDLPDLTPGSYVWWVRANFVTDVGPWSASATFRLLEQPPGKTTPLSPSGLSTAKLPLFTWSAAAGATSYTLQVDNATSEGGVMLNLVDIPADEVTRGSKCTFKSPMPLSGVLFWRVQAHNQFGDGPMSSYRYFETICSCKSGLALAKARQAEQPVKKCEACGKG